VANALAKVWPWVGLYIHILLYVFFCAGDFLLYYLRQVNEVNGGDYVCVRCGSVFLCFCVCAAERSI